MPWHQIPLFRSLRGLLNTVPLTRTPLHVKLHLMGLHTQHVVGLFRRSTYDSSSGPFTSLCK